MLLEPRQQIENLLVKYQSLSQRERRDYNEANTKNVFVQPLFEALGWDFSDINQVEAEKTIVKGRVDYIFKINRVSKFCLEVKPLRDELTDDHRKQAISYAYNKGVTWAVLTNFDKLQVFNAERQTPDLNSVLALNLNYGDYVTHFDDLSLLSRELVIDNALERVAERYGRLARRIPIEKRLYQHLRESREKLFNEIYKFHHERAVTLEDTDRLIQELFNRLLFIRTAEDRELAGNHPLLATLHQWQQDREEELIGRLRRIFEQFAQLYDSDLFPSMMDPWQQIWVSDDLLAETVKGLYDVPGDFARYDFAAIDADVLGQVYEQYLGYIAQLAKEEAKRLQRSLFPETERIEITAKREKRKAAGIYYTPKWVTDYIVRQTVGRFIEEHDHNEILNMKVLDPACGSGSFLIRAYDELLNYHAHVKGKTVAELDWMERMEVLTRNIFGVDLDPQAVEIARLNLLLRALAERKSLPPLANNIQCGNSLISGSDEELQHCLGDNFRDKKPFNWEERFPDVMKNGGFDIVIGNPPYVNEARGNKELFRELKALPKLEKYYEKNMDLFNFFVEIGLDLLKIGGFLAYIIPAYWQDRTGATLLRNKVVKETNIEHLVDLGEFRVFEGAPGQHNNIVVLRKVSSRDKTRRLKHVQVVRESVQAQDTPVLTEPRQVGYALVNNKLLIGETILTLVNKISKKDAFFLDKDEVMRGVDTSPSTHEGKGVFVLNESEYHNLRKEITREQESEFFKPFYKASQIDRYYYEPKNYYWLLYTDARRKQLLEDNREEYRVIVDHLDSFRDVITSDNKPYGLHRPKKENSFLDGDKILFLRKTHYPKFISVPIPYFVDESVYLITWHRPLCDLKYLLAIFNSTLAKWWFGRQKKHGEQLQIDKEQILSFPIRRVDFANPSEKKYHDELAALAAKMLELTQKLRQSKIEDILGERRRELEAEIEKTSQRIDRLVYQLYGITDKEREIIEASLRQSP
jgi:type I restriction-modification system DNA methylase subunit